MQQVSYLKIKYIACRMYMSSEFTAPGSDLTWAAVKWEDLWQKLILQKTVCEIRIRPGGFIHVRKGCKIVIVKAIPLLSLSSADLFSVV